MYSFKRENLLVFFIYTCTFIYPSIWDGGEQCLTINDVQVRSENAIGGCLACPQVFVENESRKTPLLLLSPPL
jgi:hypothetical protein